MKRRARMWLVAVLLAGCGRSENPEAEPGPQAVDPRPTWKELLAQAPAAAAERPPLFDPGSPGDPAQAYANAAATVPDGLSAEADGVLAHPETFGAASAELRALAASPEARTAAEAITAGASRIGGAPRVASEAELEAMRRGPARVALLTALARGTGGEPMAGAQLALAVARMGHDAARGGDLRAAMTARAVERQALVVLRALALHPKLGKQDLPALMTAVARLAASRPPIGAAMVAEIDATARRILASEPSAGIESGTHADAALTALLDERKVALELPAQSGRPLPAQLNWFEGKLCKVAGASRTCKELARYLVAAALAEAHARATQIVLAAELERRGGDKAGAPPLDPLTGKPFELVEADGKKVLRRGASALDGEPGVEPRDVPMS